jgi:hypothetical protein
MLEILFVYLLNPPSRLKILGVFFSACSAGLIILGLYLHIGVVGIDLIRSMSKVDVGYSSPSALYPSIPTWFIPESAPGFIVLIVFFVSGAYAKMYAKEIGKIYFY